MILPEYFKHHKFRLLKKINIFFAKNYKIKYLNSASAFNMCKMGLSRLTDNYRLAGQLTNNQSIDRDNDRLGS